MRILITGGAGFLGQRLAHALLKSKHIVTSLVLADIAPLRDAALLADAGIDHRPYARGIAAFAARPDGRFAATIRAATYRQDHDRKNTSLTPESITAIEDALRLAARAAGRPCRWTRCCRRWAPSC